MQHQQEFDHTSNTPEEMPAPLNERQINTDPREQQPSQEHTYRSYEEGYTHLSEQDFWPYEGDNSPLDIHRDLCPVETSMETRRNKARRMVYTSGRVE